MGYVFAAPPDMLLQGNAARKGYLMITPAKIADCALYVLRIRNKLKREYAKAYLKAIADGRLTDECYMPPERPTGLSYMGAQAVEMNIAELIKGAAGT